MNCRECNEIIPDGEEWQITGTIASPQGYGEFKGKPTSVIYPFVLAGPFGAMSEAYIHRSCVSKFFKTIESYIGSLCRELLGCAGVVVAPGEAGRREYQRPSRNAIFAATTFATVTQSGTATTIFARNVPER